MAIQLGKAQQNPGLPRPCGARNDGGCVIARPEAMAIQLRKLSLAWLDCFVTAFLAMTDPYFPLSGTNFSTLPLMQ